MEHGERMEMNTMLHDKKECNLLAVTEVAISADC